MKKYIETALLLSGFSSLLPLQASAETNFKERSNFFTDISSPPWEAIHHSDAKTHIINACLLMPVRLV